MRQLTGKFYFAIVVCFLSIFIGSATFAEKMTDSANEQREQRPSTQTLSKFLTRSNSIENLPDIANRNLREMALCKAAHDFLGDQSESLESGAYLFSDTDAEGPWFQGWYTRIINRKNGDSIAVIAATQYLPTYDFPMLDDMSLPGYLAVIVSKQNQTEIYEAFPEDTNFESNRETVLDDPAASLWEEFWWQYKYGDVIYSVTNTSIDVMISGQIHVTASLGPRLPYNADIQWLGPEGLVEFLPIVPLHWFVYSLGSKAEYKLEMLDDNDNIVEEYSGSGYAHQESNWGSIFPPAWIWSEGISSDNSRQFALSGGELTVNGASLTTWLVAYHSPRIQWQFRPTLPETEYLTSINACDGSFTIIAKDSIRKLVITANAPRTEKNYSFIDVSVPTADGFITGAEESFRAVVTVQGYIKLPWFGYVSVDKYTFKNAALEFGADYMCKELHGDLQGVGSSPDGVN